MPAVWSTGVTSKENDATAAGRACRRPRQAPPAGARGPLPSREPPEEAVPVVVAQRLRGRANSCRASSSVRARSAPAPASSLSRGRLQDPSRNGSVRHAARATASALARRAPLRLVALPLTARACISPRPDDAAIIPPSRPPARRRVYHETPMTLVVCPNLAIDRDARHRPRAARRMSRCRELRTQAGGKGANVLRATKALGGAGAADGLRRRPRGRADRRARARRGSRARGGRDRRGGARLDRRPRGRRLRHAPVRGGSGGRAARAGAGGARRRAGRPPRASGRWSPAPRRPASRRASTPRSSECRRSPATGCWSTRPASSSPARSPSGRTSSR